LLSPGRCFLFACLIVGSSLGSFGQASSNTQWLSSPSEAARIARVETGIAALEIKGQPPIKKSLQEWMQALNIPGCSVAVFDHGKLVWAKTYGVRQAGQAAPVTLDTMFQAGSISKPVAAMAALHYVQLGRFNLDENINDKLISWKVPDNEFTVTQKVTLRRLMSHTAGLTVHGFPGYAVGTKIPTVVQVLNGEPPANTAPVRVEFVPGTKFQYSGGGITIEQLMMTDQLKKPFPEIMRETVIEPLGLKNSTYEQPLPPERAAKAATAHHADGKPIDGKWHIYPEMAAAGLWTTASDLAQVALEMSASKAGKSNKVLSQAMTQQMLTVQMDQVGLGWFVNPKTDQFGHDGDDEGFQASLVAFSDRGSGIAIMVNSDMGVMLFERLTESAAKEYGWTEYHRQPDGAFMKVLLTARANGATQAIALYEAMKAEGPAKDYSPNVLNSVGYVLIEAGDLPGAIKMFEENVKLYPDDANAYDSLGEGYMDAGKKDEAIANYKKSLQLNPKNDNAVKMLKKMGVEWKAQ
jgi:CubicO group peptidase (beta-lactamase class C family)